MKIAVLSGKGGTGKTFVSVNLADVAKDSVYIDCDVEEPNGRLFFRPAETKKKPVSVLLPEFDETKCTGCRKCVRFCRFNALAYVKNKPKLFREICHSCGGCKLVCEHRAISEKPYNVGNIEIGYSENTAVVTGTLNVGEASGVPVISAALKEGLALNRETAVIDCPPGSACTVIESVKSADYCLFVAEPTAFGLHNLKMVHRLVSIMSKPCGLVVNKELQPYGPLEDFCAESKLPILLHIPYSKELAELGAEGNIAVRCSKTARSAFEKLMSDIISTVPREGVL